MQNKRKPPPYPKGNIIALDVETDGFDPYHGHRIFCWAYMSDKGEYGFMRKTPATMRWVKRLLNDSSKTIVFHNAKFDVKMFGFEGIDVYNLKAKIDCTLILAKLLNENWQHDLEYLSIRYLKRDTDDKRAVLDWIKKHKREYNKLWKRDPNFKDAPIATVKRRAIWDVESTILLHMFLKPRIDAMCPELYETERRLMFVCVDMENHGVQVDLTRAKKLRAQALKDMKRIQADLDAMVCPLTVKKKKKDKMVEEVIEHFNPGSTSIQCPAAFIKLGIELKYRTKPKKNRKKGGVKSGGGRWSFDEYAMVRYVSKPLAAVIRDSGEEGWPVKKFYDHLLRTIADHKLRAREMFPPLMLKLRELSKMVSTYYDNIIERAVDVHIEPSGREVGILHCRFNQSEAMTGRFSSSQINLQNMPRLLGPRECFVPRKGRRNWHHDYEQVEMRFFVHFSEDEKMAKAIDQDIHLMTAAEIYKKAVELITSEQRKRAKGTNFGIIYGSGPATQAETLTKKGLPTTVAEATILVANYHRAFPSVRRTTNELKVILQRQGYCANPFGRRYHIPTKFGYKMLNYLCQGTSADQMKKAMVDVWEWLRANKFKSKIIITVHDELIIEIPPSEESRVVPGVMKIMEDLTSYFVPITVDAKVVTHRWSQKRDPKEIGCDFINN